MRWSKLRSSHGQDAVDVHVFPFRMTAMALAAGEYHWAPFWRNLKAGYDLFEAAGTPPKVCSLPGRVSLWRRCGGAGMRRYRRLVLIDRLIPFLAAFVGLVALARRCRRSSIPTPRPRR